MNKKDLKNNLVFTNKETIRNVDFINQNDRFVSYGEGEILKIRVSEKEIKHPLLVGEYFYYSVSIEDLKRTNTHLRESLGFLDLDDSVSDFLSLIHEDNNFYKQIHLSYKYYVYLLCWFNSWWKTR